MNPTGIARVLTAVIKIAPLVKGWIFSDGKFNLQRSIMLLLFFVALMVGVYVMGVDTVSDTVDILDDVSDQLGYAK